MSEQDGGPAFPHGPLGMSYTGPDGYTDYQGPANEGMSLRDWFAGMAMNGILSNPSMESRTREPATEKDVADAAFAVADAMLKQRDVD